MKATKQALDRGLKYKEALRDHKTAAPSSSSKWRPPSIPLTTPVGVADMTLGDMMKKEKLSYPDAVTVFLAFNESLAKKPSKKPKKAEKANTNSSAGESAAPAEADEPQPKRKKTKAEEADKKSGKQPPAKEAGKKSRKQPPSEAPVDSVDTGKRSSVAPKAKASKAKAPPPLKRKGAFVHEPEAEVLEAPSKRLRGKTGAANQIPEDTQADQIPEDAEADQIPEDAEADQIPENPNPEEDDEDSALFKDWDELCYEYDLWRQGLPQQSELDAALKAHRNSAPVTPVPAVKSGPDAQCLLALPGPEPPRGDANDSQDSQTNLSDLGPSASQVASALDMSVLLQRVQQLELEKAELQSQLSSDSKSTTSETKDPVPEDASKEPAASKPVATPVRAKVHVFHDSPSPAPANHALPACLNDLKIKTQAQPVPRPTEMPTDGSDVKLEEPSERISSATHRKEYAKLNRLHDAGALANYPSMLALQEGTLDEKRKLLRNWVLSGQNLQACESAIEVSQESGVRGEKVWLKQNFKANCRPGSQFFDAPIPGADPGLLNKKAATTQQAPLKADVLRAFDKRKDELSQLALQEASGAGGDRIFQVCWTQSETAGSESHVTTSGVFKCSKDKHAKWCKELKKSVNGITDLIFDMGDASDDDSQRLLKDLKGHKKFNKLDPDAQAEEMDGQCDAIHDEVSLDIDECAKKAAEPPKVADVLDEKLVRATCAGDTTLTVACDLGDAYGSRLLDGYSSRPLREAEFHSTPDLSECRTDSKASRYIMYSLLVQSYLIQSKTNITLQTLNSAIVADFNKLSAEGLLVGKEVYYFIPVGFRGDLKQMGQAFNLTRKPGSEKVHFEPGSEAVRVSEELSKEPSLISAGLNMVIDPSGKLLTKRCAHKCTCRPELGLSNWPSNPVTKFKHLARRARSSHQAQLRELKAELAGYLDGEDSESEGEEDSQSPEDEDAALSSLAEHDDVESSSSVVTPPLHIPALTGEMQMVLARLQAKCAKQEPAAASTAEAADPKAVSKNKKPKKGVQKDIEEKMLPEKVLDSLRTLIPSEPAKPWAKDDEGGAANGPGDGDEEDPDGHKKAKASKKPKAKKAQDSKNCTASKVQAKKDPKKEKQDPSTDKKGEETEAMQRMKRTMTSDCAYVPGSYKGFLAGRLIAERIEATLLRFRSQLGPPVAMVVAELLRWGAPLQLIMCVVLLAFHEKALQNEDLDFLHLFSGCDSIGASFRTDLGLIGTSLDLETDPMGHDLMSISGFLSRSTSGRNHITPKGNEGYGFVHVGNVLLVFKGFFYMIRFGSPSLKRHMLLSNWQGLVEALVARAGYLSVEERTKMKTIKLAVHSQSRSAHGRSVKKKFTGLPKLLKDSQQYTEKFARALATHYRLNHAASKPQRELLVASDAGIHHNSLCAKDQMPGPRCHTDVDLGKSDYELFSDRLSAGAWSCPEDKEVVAVKSEPLEEDVQSETAELRRKRIVMEILAEKDKGKTQSSEKVEAKARRRRRSRSPSNASTLVLGSAVYASSSSASDDDK
ncbi:unnamed protein product [Symbiodinium sp. CCMP2592]|nr:unnamed protein product [Symbiodinium sp. CCMP2592]